MRSARRWPNAVAPGTARVQLRLANGFMAGQLQTVEALAPLLGVGTVAIAADSLSPRSSGGIRRSTVVARTFGALRARGFLALRDDYRDDRVHLVIGAAKAPLPELGVYDAPVTVGGFDDFMWRSVLSPSSPRAYTPIAADAAAGVTSGLPLRALAPPRRARRWVPIGAFENDGACVSPPKRGRVRYGRCRRRSFAPDRCRVVCRCR